MKYWLAGTLAGSTGGTVAGLISGELQNGLVVGAATGAIASLVGGHVFRLGEADGSSAFLVSSPICGFLGGLFASVSGDAGYFGAFLGCGIGAASGLLIPVLMDLKD